MKVREWLLVIFIILIGIICLTISGTHMLEADTFHSYIMTFVHLCFLMGIPLILVGVVYMIILIREKKKGTKS